jgi:hypothetical protein
MSEPLVRYTQEDKVAVITMDDGKANALSMADDRRAAAARSSPRRAPRPARWS